MGGNETKWNRIKTIIIERKVFQSYRWYSIRSVPKLERQRSVKVFEMSTSFRKLKPIWRYRNTPCEIFTHEFATIFSRDLWTTLSQACVPKYYYQFSCHSTGSRSFLYLINQVNERESIKTYYNFIFIDHIEWINKQFAALSYQSVASEALTEIEYNTIYKYCGACI